MADLRVHLSIVEKASWSVGNALFYRVLAMRDDRRSRGLKDHLRSRTMAQSHANTGASTPPSTATIWLANTSEGQDDQTCWEWCGPVQDGWQVGRRWWRNAAADTPAPFAETSRRICTLVSAYSTRLSLGSAAPVSPIGAPIRSPTGPMMGEQVLESADPQAQPAQQCNQDHPAGGATCLINAQVGGGLYMRGGYQSVADI